ncbi:MAG TPA: redoxin domain-containing protein [Candidatus Binatia bacterium]|nr:redoxin domain-containing protein [Candidatus Binatia bacterium]
MHDEERAYNIEGFAAATPTPANPGETMAAKVGVMAPDFAAPTLDGTIVSLSDFRDKRHVVIMTGAVTSPMCAFEIPAFNQLQREFNDRDVSFFLIYTRESHPAEHYPSHRSWEQKLAQARDLQRLENVQFPIIVDSLDGKMHRSYGTWPNALFVIHRDGRLIFRSNMANHRELRQFLEDLMAADQAAVEGRVLHLQYSERIVAHEADQVTHHRVYRRAGTKAFEDYWAKRPQHRDRWP